MRERYLSYLCNEPGPAACKSLSVSEEGVTRYLSGEERQLQMWSQLSLPAPLLESATCFTRIADSKFSKKLFRVSMARKTRIIRHASRRIRPPRQRREPRRTMQREYHRWYSHRLGMEMGVVVYGHWG